jgi:hypothetical protein
MTHRSALQLIPVALVATILAFGPIARAQMDAQGLRTSSPPSVLNDPVVKQCRLLAARRADPKLDSVTTAVDRAAELFHVQVVFDAVAKCRAALARYPNEPAAIIAHYNASEALSVLALGLKFPDSEEQALSMVLREANSTKIGRLGKQMIGFFLGSAYEYGIGAKPDRTAAMKWYAVAVEAGDPISKRELERIQAHKR